MRKHLIIACIFNHHHLVSIGFCTFILQLQRTLAQYATQKVKIHIHMFPSTSTLKHYIKALVNGSPESCFSIEKEVPLENIYVAQVPGEFGLDPKLLFDMLESIQSDEVLAIPYPLSKYSLRDAIQKDGTVDSKKAIIYNIPDTQGNYPEEPKLFMCSIPTFVGPTKPYSLYTKTPCRVIQTAPMAFVGCVGSRAGTFLR